MSEHKPSVFISYSHKDEEWKDRLLQHLRVVGDESGFDVWDDRRIRGGAAWKAEIKRAILSADVAVLLVSVDFLTSDFIKGEEIPPLLRLREERRLTILPVIVGDCPWKRVDWLRAIQARPRDGAPLESMAKAGWNAALARIAEEIDEVLAAGKASDQAPTANAGYVEDLGGGVTLEMVAIPSGQFKMGSPKDEAGRLDYEGPQRLVKVVPLFMGKFEVTQAQWRAVARWPQVSRWLNAAPSQFKGDDLPVEQVSWYDAVEFCARLSRRTGCVYRLPSEAEWEYAARAGTVTATYAGGMDILGHNNAPVLDGIAWYGGNSGVGFERSDGEASSGWPEKQYAHSRAGTRSVGRKAPNAWGLYDMLGNVWEWVEDDWHESYEGAPVDGSAWAEPVRGSDRVTRGGSWGDFARLVRAACRCWSAPDDRSGGLGFRCARVRE